MTDIIPNAGNLGTTAYERLHAEINKANNVTIPALSAEIDRTNESINQLKSVLKGLVLGTRNYLTNTDFYNGSTHWDLGPATSVSDDSTVSVYHRKSIAIKAENNTSNSYQGASQTTNYFKNKQGQILCASVMVYSKDISTFDLGAKLEVVFLDNDNKRINTQVTDITPSTNYVWQRKYMTFTVPAGTVNTRFFFYVVKNGTLYVNAPKLEAGNRPSDWTPSPEDIDDRFIAVNSSIAKVNNTLTNSKLPKVYSSWSSFKTAVEAATSGDTIYLKAGVYTPNSAILVPNGVTVAGFDFTGSDMTYLKCGNSCSLNNIFRNRLTGSEGGYTGSGSITIEGFYFYGENSIKNITPVCFSHSHAVVVRRCKFSGFNQWNNIEFNGVNGGLIEQCVFENYGTSSGATNATEVIQLDYMGSKNQFPWTGKLDNTPCKNIKIRDNIFDNIKTTASGAIVGNHSTGQRIKNIEIYGNRLDNVDCFYCLGSSADINIHHNHGINVGSFVKLVTGTSGKILNIDVNHNNIGGRLSQGDSNNEERFINGPGEDVVDGIIVSNNIISNFRGHAIALTGETAIISGNKIAGVKRSGIYLYGVTDFTVTGNVVLDWDRAHQGNGAIQWGGNPNKATGYGTIIGNKGKLAIKDNVVAGTIAETGNCTE